MMYRATDTRTHRQLRSRFNISARSWPVPALLVLTFCCASSAQAAGPLPITEVTVFKDGHAYVVHQGELPVGDDGQVLTDTVPAPVLGTFWAYSAEPAARLTGVVAGELPTTSSTPVLTIRQLLEANVGREAILRFDLDAGNHQRSRRGTIVAVPPAGDDGRGEIVLLEDGDGTRVFAVDRVVEAVFPTAPRTELRREQRQKQLCFDLAWDRRPLATATVGMVYVQKGLRWIPVYRVDIDGHGQARVDLQATLVNELADLDGASANLVVGVPAFRFADSLDPVALRQEAERLSSFFQRDTQVAAAFSNAIMTQQAFVPVEDQAEATAPLPDLDDPRRAEDLYVFTVEDVTLARGERLVVPIATARLEYRDVYTLDIGISPPAEVWRRFSQNQQDEVNRLLASPRVQHALRLENAGPHPITTAPALVIRDGRPLAQGMTTYTPVGSRSDLPLTTAVDIPVSRAEHELGREHDAVRWEGNSYARINLEGIIRLSNRKADPVEIEVTRHVLGEVASASHDGTITAANTFEEPSFTANLLPPWWHWYGWPYWWHHFNGIGSIRWRVTLQPGESVELTYRWSYYWR